MTKVIAFYLPQYHPTPNNDEWWGRGFTEWTNVAKAKKLYPGHYQPKVPADLGFYDLRLPEVREQQAELAKEAGVDGFCYYHYWFSEGNEELDLPFKQVVAYKKPDFPFCFVGRMNHGILNSGIRMVLHRKNFLQNKNIWEKRIMRLISIHF